MKLTKDSKPWFEDPRLTHLPFHMRGDELTKLINIDAKRTLCERCNGTGNELYSMYCECRDCKGKGHKIDS